MNWEELSRATPHELVGWAERRPWARAMAACAQDPEWHAEGDVWTHTLMVLRKTLELDEWADLSPRQRTLLTFAALLHDVAKPLTTETDPTTGRVSSPKHAVKGEHVARAILRDVGCPLAIREEICRLVRYHGRPVFLLDKPDPTHEVVRLSWLVENRLLHLFALADFRGRDTDSQNRTEDDLHLWRLAAEEAGCYERPFPFATDHARFTFFRSDRPDLHYTPHEDFSCTATVLAGLPGAGKDRWLAVNRPELPVVSLDDLRDELDVAPTDDQGRVAQLAKERCRERLRAGESFAFNATNTTAQTRGRWLDLFADYRARIEIVYLEPPLERILAQNKSRGKAVPEAVIRRLAERCEPPTWPECHRLTLSENEAA